MVNKKRGLDSKRAREVRQKGHDDALEFAKIIGIERDYSNNPIGKKDVVDSNGDTHSVKSGVKKWQIFLYGKSRFTEDRGFSVMNGIGDLLVRCIDCFPDQIETYQINKEKYKNELIPIMTQLKEKLSNSEKLEAFLSKSIFNGTEVDYLTIKENNLYHVFYREDVIKCFSQNLKVENSMARNPTQMSCQKVIFKSKGYNLGEIEMRNDSEKHYRQIRFNMLKRRAIELLSEKIPSNNHMYFNNKVKLYGKSIKKFKGAN